MSVAWRNRADYCRFLSVSVTFYGSPLNSSRQSSRKRT